MKITKALLTRTVTALALVSICIGIYYYLPPLAMTLALTGTLIWIIAFEWPPLVKAQPWLIWLTPFYPVAPFTMLILLYNTTEYMPLIVLMCLLTITHDTAGYLIGNLYGKHLMCPSITPKKTYEGLAGSYICTSIMLFIFCKTLPSFNIHTLYLFILSLSVSTLATLGDLFESYLKRKAHIKDSGAILPGHGGFLDRIDALLFVIPLFYILRTPLLELITK